MSGYNPCTSGTSVGADIQSVNQQPYFTSSGYLQPSVQYVSEGLSSHFCDAMAKVGESNSKPNASPLNTTMKSRGLNYIKTNIAADKVSTHASNSNSHSSTASCNVSSSACCEPLKASNKVPQQVSGLRSAGLLKGHRPIERVPSFSKQGLGGPFQQNGFSNGRSDAQIWAGNDKFKMSEKLSGDGVFDISGNLIRGPRSSSLKDPLMSSVKKDNLSPLFRRDQYNLKDFQIKYEQAMFFVIKSFSEDDVHKSIKYNVWASTPNGNKKLDAAFHSAETKSSEKGTSFPIFLFFSVNGSGQFMGLAEMIGPVDFKKTMDFWQQDRWNGFFPVKWHIVKDIPNNVFRHIILENNDNNAVTKSRDTQEIRFPQGSEMLNIFKNYPVKKSILDDLSFYEHRETLKVNKHPLPNLGVYTKNYSPNSDSSTERIFETSSRAKKNSTDAKQGLVLLTRNLSINGRSPKEGRTERNQLQCNQYGLGKK